ncbi:MAG: glycosyl transferase family 2 [Chitinophagaceae bacterium]|nr:glycosyl transferase family 2 [Chitinophagaceae bacterium]
MKLSIIIVNYYAADMIADCLQSVFQYNKELDFEVIVVSNSSGKEDKKKLTSFFPQINWVEMDYNAGFARANNAGIRAAKAPVILLLNPDTLAVDDSLTRCVEMFRQSPYIACGIQLLNEDKTPQISGSFFMKGGLNHLLPLPYWGNLLRWMAFRLKTKIPNVPQARSVEEVDWISGAFLMVKKEMVVKAGLMDEDFFLYAEEVEWCSRLRKIGKLALFGDLHFIHLQGEAINKDQNSTEKGYAGLFDKKGLQVMLSNHVRIRKQYGTGWFLFILLNYTWGIGVYAAASFIHRLFTLRNPLAEWPQVFAFAKNVFSIWKLAPVIIRNHPHFYKAL